MTNEGEASLIVGTDSNESNTVTNADKQVASQEERKDEGVCVSERTGAQVELPQTILALAPEVPDKLRNKGDSQTQLSLSERMVNTVIYLQEILKTNTSLEQKDCATLYSFIAKIIRGQLAPYAANGEPYSDSIDFDQFHVDIL